MQKVYMIYFHSHIVCNTLFCKKKKLMHAYIIFLTFNNKFCFYSFLIKMFRSFYVYKNERILYKITY